MNNEKQEAIKLASQVPNATREKKSIYDGLKITKRGLDLTIVFLSLSIISLLAVLLFKQH